MKKTRFIVLALAMAIMLLGAGYAYWSDQLVVHNSVTTGEMNVEFVEEGMYPYCGAFDGYVTSEINQDDSKTTTVEFGNMYPNTFSYYGAKIENKGTIPAVFDEANVSFTADTDQELKDNLVTLIGYLHYDSDGLFKDSNFAISGNLDNLKSTLDNLFAGLRLEPGEFITLDLPEEGINEAMNYVEGYEASDFEENSVYFLLPYWVENGDNVENTSATFDMTIDWKQHNEF